ncbi:hypothetical protein HK102_011184, partial [Quaeritorhiza haematococci]
MSVAAAEHHPLLTAEVEHKQVSFPSLPALPVTSSTTAINAIAVNAITAAGSAGSQQLLQPLENPTIKTSSSAIPKISNHDFSEFSGSPLGSSSRAYTIADLRRVAAQNRMKTNQNSSNRESGHSSAIGSAQPDMNKRRASTSNVRRKSVSKVQAIGPVSRRSSTFVIDRALEARIQRLIDLKGISQIPQKRESLVAENADSRHGLAALPVFGEEVMAPVRPEPAANHQTMLEQRFQQSRLECAKKLHEIITNATKRAEAIMADFQSVWKEHIEETNRVCEELATQNFLKALSRSQFDDLKQKTTETMTREREEMLVKLEMDLEKVEQVRGEQASETIIGFGKSLGKLLHNSPSLVTRVVQEETTLVNLSILQNRESIVKYCAAMRTVNLGMASKMKAVFNETYGSWQKIRSEYVWGSYVRELHTILNDHDFKAIFQEHQTAFNEISNKQSELITTLTQTPFETLTTDTLTTWSAQFMATSGELEQRVKKFGQDMSRVEQDVSTRVRALFETWLPAMVECEVEMAADVERRLNDEWSKLWRSSDILPGKRAGLVLPSQMSRNRDVVLLIRDFILCILALKNDMKNQIKGIEQERANRLRDAHASYNSQTKYYENWLHREMLRDLFDPQDGDDVEEGEEEGGSDAGGAVNDEDGEGGKQSGRKGEVALQKRKEKCRDILKAIENGHENFRNRALTIITSFEEHIPKEFAFYRDQICGYLNVQSQAEEPTPVQTKSNEVALKKKGTTKDSTSKSRTLVKSDSKNWETDAPQKPVVQYNVPQAPNELEFMARRVIERYQYQQARQQQQQLQQVQGHQFGTVPDGAGYIFGIDGTTAAGEGVDKGKAAVSGQETMKRDQYQQRDEGVVKQPNETNTQGNESGVQQGGDIPPDTFSSTQQKAPSTAEAVLFNVNNDAAMNELGEGESPASPPELVVQVHTVADTLLYDLRKTLSISILLESFRWESIYVHGNSIGNSTTSPQTQTYLEQLGIPNPLWPTQKSEMLQDLENGLRVALYDVELKEEDLQRWYHSKLEELADARTAALTTSYSIEEKVRAMQGVYAAAVQEIEKSCAEFVEKEVKGFVGVGFGMSGVGNGGKSRGGSVVSNKGDTPTYNPQRQILKSQQQQQVPFASRPGTSGSKPPVGTQPNLSTPSVPLDSSATAQPTSSAPPQQPQLRPTSYWDPSSPIFSAALSSQTITSQHRTLQHLKRQFEILLTTHQQYISKRAEDALGKYKQALAELRKTAEMGVGQRDVRKEEIKGGNKNVDGTNRSTVVDAAARLAKRYQDAWALFEEREGLYASLNASSPRTKPQRAVRNNISIVDGAPAATANGITGTSPSPGLTQLASDEKRDPQRSDPGFLLLKILEEWPMKQFESRLDKAMKEVLETAQGVRGTLEARLEECVLLEKVAGHVQTLRLKIKGEMTKCKTMEDTISRQVDELESTMFMDDMSYSDIERLCAHLHTLRSTLHNQARYLNCIKPTSTCLKRITQKEQDLSKSGGRAKKALKWKGEDGKVVECAAGSVEEWVREMI